MYDYTYISIICSIFLGVAITCQFFWTPAASATSETPRCVETKPWNTATRLPRIHLGRWWFFGDLMVCQWGNHIHILYNIYIWIIINPFCGNKIGYIMIYIYDIHWNTVIDCILHDVWVCLKIGIYYHLVPQHCHHERENHQMQKRGLSLFWDTSNIMAGWWFGTLILWFSIIVGNFIIPIDELHHFSEG